MMMKGNVYGLPVRLRKSGPIHGFFCKRSRQLLTRAQPTQLRRTRLGQSPRSQTASPVLSASSVMPLPGSVMPRRGCQPTGRGRGGAAAAPRTASPRPSRAGTGRRSRCPVPRGSTGYQDGGGGLMEKLAVTLSTSNDVYSVIY